MYSKEYVSYKYFSLPLFYFHFLQQKITFQHIWIVHTIIWEQLLWPLYPPFKYELFLQLTNECVGVAVWIFLLFSWEEQVTVPAVRNALFLIAKPHADIVAWWRGYVTAESHAKSGGFLQGNCYLFNRLILTYGACLWAALSLQTECCYVPPRGNNSKISKFPKIHQKICRIPHFWAEN